ncbi:MORN repeat-containing protein 1 [Fasciola gigantica]|uniref:MORN repeat-containing protein 1 n=1 Tax=Fasciola gigantica TaxID=46835 RepID=A0A504Y6S5_FASGI|nr:MORN repeat-containing protein 1 [Fasciola gigantica]
MLTGKYSGQTNSIQRDGFGVYTYGHGYFQYAGQWEHGVKHGHGKLLMRDGSFYEGTFDRNEITGQGKQYYAQSNSTYEGEFHLGERHGRGKMIFSSGNVYQGEWVSNRMEGEGELSYRDRSSYVGSFVQNKKHGYGQLKTDMLTYAGLWNADIFEGHGTLLLATGEIYEGEFLEGKPHGLGTLTRTHSKAPSYTGLWDMGFPVQKPFVLKVFSEETGSALGRLESYHYGSSTAGSAGRSIASPFTQAEYKISSAEMQTGFEITVCVYTEAGKLLTEESRRQLLLWIARKTPEAQNENLVVYANCELSPLLKHLDEGDQGSIPTPFGFCAVPVTGNEDEAKVALQTGSITEDLNWKSNEHSGSLTLAEVIQNMGPEKLEGAEGLGNTENIKPVSKSMAQFFIEETGRGCARWDNLKIQLDPVLSSTEKISGEVAEDVILQSDEYVVIVEDITPCDVNPQFVSENPYISPDVLQPPPRLPTLYIRLVVLETQLE